MQIDNVTYRDVDHTSDLLERLQGRVFHLTTQKAFNLILGSGKIYNNADARFPLNATSESSFGRKNRLVCLFDLRNVSNVTLQDAHMRYNFTKPSWFEIVTIDYSRYALAYLFISEAAWPSLIPNEFARKQDHYGHYLREVEVWYPNELPIEFIESVLLVEICNKAQKDNEFLYAHHLLAVSDKLHE